MTGSDEARTDGGHAAVAYPAARSPRVVNWFSHGAASAIATKMSLARYPEGRILCIDTGSEHPDNERFREDCERWFERPIQVVRSKDYADVDDVIERTRYLVGPTGARCTTELKKKVRWEWQDAFDLQVFGYTADTQDAKRASRFVLQNPEATAWFPLVERNITKADCLVLLERAGIELPEMYRLGYTNNNCLGCVKGGMGYWNKIRQDFPEVFAKRAAQERELGRSILRESVPDGPGYWAPSDLGGEVFIQPRKSVQVFLDELDPERGRYEPIDMQSCDLDCTVVESEWQPVKIRGAA